MLHNLQGLWQQWIGNRTKYILYGWKNEKNYAMPKIFHIFLFIIHLWGFVVQGYEWTWYNIDHAASEGVRREIVLSNDSKQIGSSFTFSTSFILFSWNWFPSTLSLFGSISMGIHSNLKHFVQSLLNLIMFCWWLWLGSRKCLSEEMNNAVNFNYWARDTGVNKPCERNFLFLSFNLSSLRALKGDGRKWRQ